MSLITSHGKPLAIALPFDDELLEAGVHISLAVRMFEQQHVSLASGAKIARKSVEDFIVILGESGVDAVQYDAAELERDLAHIG